MYGRGKIDLLQARVIGAPRDHHQDCDRAKLARRNTGWIGLRLDREQARRGIRRFQSRLRAANLRHGDAGMENLD
jgi:hypothetical protein